MQAVGRQLDIGFHHHFAGIRVHHIGGGQRAIQLGGFHFHLLDVCAAQRLERMRRDLAARVRDLLAAMLDGVRRLGAH